ncbi:MAG: 7-cyano-7-deazaguanine synthase, partial [Rhabdochlamydiaceae bacterium]
FAEILDAKYIVGGHNKNDVESFPDSSQSFFDQFNKVATIGRISKDKTGRVILPLARLDKSQIVKLGTELGVPFELTWSCYNESELPCGTCLSCKLRYKAFAKVGVEDPLIKARS